MWRNIKIYFKIILNSFEKLDLYPGLSMQVILSNMTYRPHVGGIENSLYHIAKVLQRSKIIVHIVCSDKGIDPLVRLPRYEYVDGIHIHRYRRITPASPLMRLLQIIHDLTSSYRLLKRVGSVYQVRLHLSRNSRIGFAGKYALAGCRNIYVVPAIGLVQDRTIKRNRRITSRIKNAINNHIILKISHQIQLLHLRYVDKVVVFSENMEYHTLQLMPNKHSSIVRLNPGVDSSRFYSNREKKNELRSRISIPNKSFVFCIVSRFVQVKGIELAIQALSQINAPSIMLLIIGTGPEKATYQELIFKLELEDRVKILDKTSSPEEFYQLSDAFIMSSHYEPFGQTIIEAMATELPIIAFDSGCNNVNTATSEIVSHSVNGYLSDYSIQDLAAWMEKVTVIENTTRLEMGRVNRTLVKKHYTWEGFVKKILSIK